jgi:hypothetical protein
LPKAAPPCGKIDNVTMVGEQDYLQRCAHFRRHVTGSLAANRPL